MQSVGTVQVREKHDVLTTLNLGICVHDFTYLTQPDCHKNSSFLSMHGLHSFHLITYLCGSLQRTLLV